MNTADWLFIGAILIAVGLVVLGTHYAHRRNGPLLDHRHNWSYEGVDRWSDERMRMEHREVCIAAFGDGLPSHDRTIPWEEHEYRRNFGVPVPTCYCGDRDHWMTVHANMPRIHLVEELFDE
jgi:hypothetical protein